MDTLRIGRGQTGANTGMEQESAIIGKATVLHLLVQATIQLVRKWIFETGVRPEQYPYRAGGGEGSLPPSRVSGTRK